MWPFRRRRKAPIDGRVWNDDWAPGDLAECIADSFADAAPCNPKVGDVLRVVDVCDAVNHNNVRAYFLFFEGRPRELGWSSQAFRKLRPVQEPAEDEFTTWIRDVTRTPEHVS